jgi:hypothetical protein
LGTDDPAKNYFERVDSISEPERERHEAPIEAFLEQPAFHAKEDLEERSKDPTQSVVPVSSRWRRIQRWFSHFMFEKEPSPYSSISPRTPDGKRTKIFFFNGNGRGR